jgi:peptidoglycan-associated lipoprotein
MKRKAHSLAARMLLIGTSALVGCAHERTPPPEPPPAPEPAVGLTQTTSQAVAAPRATPPQVNVSDEILKACKIDFDNVETAPKFDFDRSDLRDGERGLLQKVATCLTTGPLKGRALRLVGRADPRGETEYNFALGASRAESVRAYLMGLGLSAQNVATTSRGKLDATGTDEEGWQRDRRVDIDLQ